MSEKFDLPGAIEAFLRERRAAAGNEAPPVARSRDMSHRGRDPEHDAALRTQVEAVRNATSELYRVVSECRRAGYSFADVGAVLGVSRQAAWERFHAYVDREHVKDMEWES